MTNHFAGMPGVSWEDGKMSIEMEKLVPYIERAGINTISLLYLNGVLTLSLKDLKTLKLKEKKKTQDKEKKKWDEATFNDLWERYPLKTGKKAAITHFKATVKNAEDMNNIQVALTKYIKYITERDASKPFLYWKGGGTWFNEWEDWVMFVSPFANPLEDHKFTL